MSQHNTGGRSLVLAVVAQEQENVSYVREAATHRRMVGTVGIVNLQVCAQCVAIFRSDWKYVAYVAEMDCARIFSVLTGKVDAQVKTDLALAQYAMALENAVGATVKGP